MDPKLFQNVALPGSVKYCKTWWKYLSCIRPN